MSSQPQTKSEVLFEEFCKQQGVALARLPVVRTRKQPDYELMLNSRQIVVEVKQVEPNEDDLRRRRALDSGGVYLQHRDPNDVAARVRKPIAESRSQLKSYLGSRPATPALLVVFDNADNGYTDPYIVQVALHGWEEVTLSVGKSAQAPVVIDRGFGARNNRTLRVDNNTHLSAMVTLHEYWEFTTRKRGLALQFYHNPFAAVKFEPDWWRGEQIKHLQIGPKTVGQYQEWVEV